ncbi:MAG TPA: triose-phosphate isomerase [Candidatus Lokiarchaeia archaeon]|nr:triose-phosphate isomerase [Candidatus Lokiarchaeia archaeon]
MRRFVIGGNWKMNRGTAAEASEMLYPFLDAVKDIQNVDIMIAPPFTAIATALVLVRDHQVQVGAQNMWYEEHGAFTGELSPDFLVSLGVKWVILGHSERRHTVAAETDEIVNRKVKSALEVGLSPIVCIGETAEQRKAGQTEEILRTQVAGSLADLTPAEMQRTVIAYEPVWAIGTGVNATPDQAEDAHRFIRGLLYDTYGALVSESVRIQYGGSLKPENAQEIFEQSDVDGGLVGGASLEAESFAKICQIASEIQK